MPKHRISLLTLSWLLLTSAAASAQEKGQTGLTMAFPASVGLIWHVSDHVALRPEVSFSFSKASTDSSTSPVASSVDGSSFAVGLSGLFYLRKWEGLSTYVSPRFSYGRTSTTVTTSVTLSLPPGFTGGSISNSPSENTSSIYSVSGSFGAQYSLSRKFGVFGEAGLGYTDQRSSSSSKAHTFGTRAGVGVLFYF